MKIYALLTGKKNSSLIGKNYIKIFNKPVCVYPAQSAKRSKLINNFYVSSDSEKILNLVGKKGYIKIKRPRKLALKNSLHYDVLKHFITCLDKNKIPDIIVVLLANSPTIKTSWIDKCLKKIINNKKISAVVPVIKNNDFHPFRAKKISQNRLIPFFEFKKKISSNRQDLTNSYFLSHNFWVLKTKEIILNKGHQPWTFMGKNVHPYFINSTADIHSKNDIKKCEEWLKKNSIYK